MVLSLGIISNIRDAFKRSLQHSRAYSDNPYINVLRYSLTGGDKSLGIAPDKIDESIYFVEADIDMNSRVRLPMGEMTNMVSTSTDVFYVDCGYIYDTDHIEYYSEARITGQAYGPVIKCYDSRFIENDISVGSPVYVYTANSPSSPGISGAITGYNMIAQSTVVSVDNDWQISISGSLPLTGGDTVAFMVGYPSQYRIDSVLYTPEFGYTMVRATVLDNSAYIP